MTFFRPVVAILTLVLASLPLAGRLPGVDAARLAPRPHHPHFLGPRGIGVDSAGNVYVADDSGITGSRNFGSRVLKLSANGNLLAAFTSIDSGHGKYGELFGLALDRSRNIYVSTSNGGGEPVFVPGFDYIRKLSPQGKPLAVWGKLGYAATGAGPGTLAWPWGLATDARGNVYTAECDNNRVQKFSPQGRSLALWNDLNLKCPMGIAVNAQGGVFVADHGNNRVLMLSPQGVILHSWASTGPASAKADFTDPAGLALDRQGSIYVVVTNFSRAPRPAQIIKMSPSGKLLARWRYNSSAQPSNVAVDAHGSVYVTSAEGQQIVKYSPRGKVVAVWK